MGPGLSFHDTAYAAASPVRRDAKQARKSVTRRGKRLPALVRVPMLDWPSDLFSDNVSMAELVAEDFPVEWDLSNGQHDPASYFQFAA